MKSEQSTPLSVLSVMFLNSENDSLTEMYNISWYSFFIHASERQRGGQQVLNLKSTLLSFIDVIWLKPCLSQY